MDLIKVGQLRAASMDDLSELNRMVVMVLREKQSEKQQIAARAFRVTERAKFWSAKYAENVIIVIDKINTKTVSGRRIIDNVVSNQIWRVTPSMLTPA